MNNTNTPPDLVPFGADQNIGNAITVTSGFFVSSATSVYDSTGLHNLTLSGPISETTNGRVLTNNMSNGATLFLGLATNPSTITLGSTKGVSLTIQSQTTLPGINGVTVINDVIQDASLGGAGTMIAQLGGTVDLNANNTFSGGLQINGATVVVSVDANMGSATGGVNIGGTFGASTLLSSGTFSSARTFNLASSATNIIDATGTNVLTLTGALTGTGDLTKGTNSGTLQLAQAAGGSVSGNVNVNGGSLLVGPTGGETAPFGIGGTLTVNNGAKAAVSQGVSSYSVTNSISNVVINGSGQVDIANSGLATTTDAGTIRQYLVNGFNNGHWNGTGGITSVNAAGDFASNGANATRALGFASGTGAVGMGLGLATNQTLVKFTIYGDADLSGGVDISDLNIVLNNFLGGNTWDTGDMYYSGSTDISDLNAVLNNFFASAPVSSRPLSLAKAHAAAASVSTAHTLTGTASPDANPPTPAFNTLELVVNTSTGDVQIIGNNTQTGDTQITSSSNGIITANWHDLKSQGFSNWQDTAKKAFGIGEFDTQFAATGDFALINTIDYGNIYNTTANAEDYIFKYGAVDQTTGLLDTLTGSVFYVSGVPEPTTLSLIGIGAIGLLARRRRSNPGGT